MNFYQNIDGQWEGECTNVTHNVSAPMTLLIWQDGTGINGIMKIFSTELGGDGFFEGTLAGNNVIFSTNPTSEFEIIWKGDLSNDGGTIVGHYSVPGFGEDGTFYLKKIWK